VVVVVMLVGDRPEDALDLSLLPLHSNPSNSPPHPPPSGQLTWKDQRHTAPLQGSQVARLGGVLGRGVRSEASNNSCMPTDRGLLPPPSLERIDRYDSLPASARCLVLPSPDFQLARPCDRGLGEPSSCPVEPQRWREVGGHGSR
jgi:hypothetical protein